MSTVIACSLPQRLRGLFGRRGFAGELLLIPCNDVHTFGMSCPIDVAFIASDGEVLESHRYVAAWRRLRCKQACATLERFARDGPWIDAGDHIELTQLVRAGLMEQGETTRKGGGNEELSRMWSNNVR